MSDRDLAESSAVATRESVAFTDGWRRGVGTAQHLAERVEALEAALDAIVDNNCCDHRNSVRQEWCYEVWPVDPDRWCGWCVALIARAVLASGDRPDDEGGE